MVTRFRQNHKPRLNAAFTLAEVVIAVGVLGVTLGAFFAALAGGLEIVDATRQELRATQILTQKTEAVRLCTWHELNTLPSTFQDYYYTATTTNTTAHLTYYGTISVTNANCIPNTVSYYTNIDLVTVSLVWTNYLGMHAIAHSRSMSTLVAYYGLVNYLYGQDFIQQ